MDWHPARSTEWPVQVAWVAVAGIAYGFAFHPLPVASWPLGVVALIPFLVVLGRVDAHRALWLGCVMGFSATAVGFSWLPGALASFSSLNMPAAYGACTLVWIWHGGRFALFALFAVRARRNGWPSSLGIIAAFAASEILYPVVLPWYHAGSVHDALVLLQVGDLGGPILIGIVALSLSVLVAHAVGRWRAAATLLDRRETGILVALVAGAIAYGGFRLGVSHRDDSNGPGLRLSIGIVQGNADPDQKERDPVGALRQLLVLSKRLVEESPVDVVIWSETSTGYSVDEQLLGRWVKEVVAPHVPVPMVLGTGIIGDHGQRTYNAAISTLANGQVVARYDKRRLFPIGEYTPVGALLRGLAPRSANFTEGSAGGAFTVLGRPVAVTICYEGLWPALVNENVRAHDAELLLNLTNDIRFGDTAEPWMHFAFTKLRAIEHRRYLVRATNSGISAVVDPAGRVKTASELFKEQAILGNVFLIPGRTLYERLGDTPWYAISVVCLLMILVRRGGRAVFT